MTIPLHRIRFQWSDGVCLDLEWVKGRGIPTTLSDFPPEVTYVENEAEPDIACLHGIPPICYRADSPAIFEPFQLRENTEYFLDVALPVSRDFAAAAMEQQPGWPFDARLRYVFQSDPPRRWQTDKHGRLIVSGLLRLRSHAGILDLRTPFGGPLRLEVVCQKIGYLEEFRTLLDQVASELAELLLQYDSPVSAEFTITDATSTNEASLLFQLRNVMAPHNLPSAIDEILGRLHARLYSRHGIANLGEVEEPDTETLASELDITSLRAGGPLRRFFGGYTPQSFPIVEQYASRDTPENRYVKYFLEEVLLLSTRLRDRLAAAGKVASVREVTTWIEHLQELLSRREWKDVGQFRHFPSNSQLLQKGRGYREIVRFNLSIRMGLELPWKRAAELAEGIYGDLRPVNELYEYWCFFVLRRALAEICQKEQVSRNTLIQISADGLSVSLRRGYRSRTSFLYRETRDVRVEVNLFYNRRFKRPTKALSSWLGSYTANFDPDFSIEIVVHRVDGVRRHWLHFDAKYRFDHADFETHLGNEQTLTTSNGESYGSSYEKELKRIHKREDLFKMHTYRDGILSSRGAYIIYPGDDEDLILQGSRQNFFVRHPAAFDGNPLCKIPSVGVFSLSPNREAVQRAVLSNFLLEVLEALSSAAVYTEETGIFTRVMR